MPSPHEPPLPLRDLQVAFAQGLRERTLDDACRTLLTTDVDATSVAEQFDVYTNNAWQFFLGALERAYPVVRRRVGDSYFRQLAREYRTQHPSRHGDLHWVGATFPSWLVTHLAATGYDWLADLARLEWACEESACAAHAEPVPVHHLGAIDPESLALVRLRFHPSLRQVDSPFPIWSVWQANQDDAAAVPIDLALGGEHCAIACVAEGVAVHRLDATDYRLLQRLAAGDDLTAALAATASEPDALFRLLAWVFAEGLVTGINPSVPE